MWEENLTQHLATQHPKQPTVPEQQPSLRRKRRFRYQCPHCWRSFVVQPSLEKHIRDMHVAKKNPGKKYLCSLCGLESLTPNKLNIHMRWLLPGPGGRPRRRLTGVGSGSDGLTLNGKMTLVLPLKLKMIQT